jgi:hypothetical protein
VVCASANPFDDEYFKHESTAHERLVKVLLDTLTSDERLVQVRAAAARLEPLPELGVGARITWRAIVVFLFPAILVLVAVARNGGEWRRAPGARTRQAGSWRAAARWLLPVAAVLLLVAIVRPLQLRADLTQDKINTLAPETVALVKQLASEPATRAELIFSARERLPASMRPRVARLADTLHAIERAGARLETVRIDADDLEAGERERLAAAGIQPAKVTVEEDSVTSVRSLYGALRLTRGDRTEVLPFASPEAFEQIEFRLAFAFDRLLTGRSPHVAFASDAPRLSSAEAWEYQQKGLSPPVGTDVYSLAREVVSGLDFRVTHVNPRDPVMPSDADVLVWLQPRRDVCAMTEQMIRFLHHGGKVLLVAQHFNIQSRQYPGTDFKIVYWPQPQSPDVEEMYFPDIGIMLVREVLFDELKTRISMESQVNRSAVREYRAMEAALPIMIRASTASFASDSLITRDIGDQALLYANFFRLDPERLAHYGLEVKPLITTSEHAWTFLWKGGWLPDDLLAGPPLDEHGVPRYLGRVPLAIEVRGIFPLPGEKLSITPPQFGVGAAGTDPPKEKAKPLNPPDDPGQPGRLVFIGCSEAFKNPHLLDPEFRADRLLVNTVAALALDVPLAQVATRRPVPRGLGLVPPGDRLVWRGVVLAALPVALLLFGLVWRLKRR